MSCGQIGRRLLYRANSITYNTCMAKVLFVCRSNVARSQMAKELYNLRNHGGADAMGIRVDEPGQKLKEIAITPYIFDVMDEVGINMRNNERIKLDLNKLQGYQKIIVMLDDTSQVPEYLQRDPRVEFWDIEDHKYMELDDTRKVRDLLQAKINTLF